MLAKNNCLQNDKRPQSPVIAVMQNFLVLWHLQGHLSVANLQRKSASFAFNLCMKILDTLEEFTFVFCFPYPATSLSNEKSKCDNIPK